MINHALQWVDRGFAVFPCRPRDKAPEWRLVPKDKDPADKPIEGSGGFKKANRDPGVVRDWWKRVPDANIGVVPGEGFFVLDLDGPDAVSWFINASGRHGEPDKTLTVKTREGRFHLYFYAECDIPCSTGRIAPHVDVKAGTDGYVIGAPSIHPDGHTYKIVRDLPIAEAPRWLTDLAIPDEKPFEAPQADIPAACQSDFNPKYVRAAVESELDAVANSGEGGRNVALHCAAIKLGTLSAAGAIARPAAEAALFAAAARSGLPAFEIRKTLASGFKYGEKHPRSAPQMNKGGRYGSSL
jgi:Bifunctional DNA primase/polymerase, N-terminal